jgi:hypothetical protein
MGMIKSATSQQVRTLEVEVDTKLLDTWVRPTRLTDVDGELLRHARVIIFDRCLLSRCEQGVPTVRQAFHEFVLAEGVS